MPTRSRHYRSLAVMYFAYALPNESIRDNHTHTHSRRTDTISLARHPFAMDVMVGLPSTGRTNLHKQTKKTNPKWSTYERQTER